MYGVFEGSSFKMISLSWFARYETGNTISLTIRNPEISKGDPDDFLVSSKNPVLYVMKDFKNIYHPAPPGMYIWRDNP